MRTVMLPIVLLVSLLVPGRQSGAEREDWIQLFNGKNLDGWVPKITGYPLGENYADTFRVVKEIFSKPAEPEIIRRIANRGDLAVEGLAD